MQKKISGYKGKQTNLRTYEQTDKSPDIRANRQISGHTGEQTNLRTYGRADKSPDIRATDKHMEDIL